MENGMETFRLASTVLIAAGAGFIGSGFGIAIASHRRPSVRSGWNSTIVSVLVGLSLIAFALYRGAPWVATANG